jgi:hypothetical protein
MREFDAVYGIIMAAALGLAIWAVIAVTFIG